MRWLGLPPRPPFSEVGFPDWARNLIAWLDRQEQTVPLFPALTEVVFDNAAQLGVNRACYHSLSIPVLSPTVPNCAWIICGLRHSGLVAAPPAVSAFYTDGVIAKNSIELKFFAPGLTVNLANPLTVLLGFIQEPIPRIPQT